MSYFLSSSNRKNTPRVKGKSLLVDKEIQETKEPNVRMQEILRQCYEDYDKTPSIDSREKVPLDIKSIVDEAYNEGPSLSVPSKPNMQDVLLEAYEGYDFASAVPVPPKHDYDMTEILRQAYEPCRELPPVPPTVDMQTILGEAYGGLAVPEKPPPIPKRRIKEILEETYTY